MRKPLACTVIFVFCTSTVSLCGCWGRLELQDTAFVVLMGLDAVQSSSGEPLPTSEAGLEVTQAIAISRALPSGRDGGGGRGPAPMVVLPMVAPNLTVAGESIEESVSRRVRTTHVEALIVGEALARQGLEDVLDQTLRYSNLRHTIHVIIAEGSARELITSLAPSIEVGPWTEARKAVQSIQGRVSNQLHLHDLLVSSSSKSKDAMLPMMRTWQEIAVGGGESAARPGRGPAITGVAVFKDATMVGKLDEVEAAHALMLHGSFRRAFMSYPLSASADDGVLSNRNLVGIEWDSVKAQKRVTMIGERAAINVNLDMEGGVMEARGDVDLTSPEGVRRLERQVAQSVRFHCQRVVEKVQREMAGADIFYFGDVLRTTFKTWDEWEKFDWPKRFQEAVVTINVTVHLRRPGLTLQNPWKLH
ncbi:MAG TPA: Ger(x)C family spore germination protein [Firmicutes bacterium]|nr:Ger(x)C family spore germination protein [Bacillota bacterium]